MSVRAHMTQTALSRLCREWQRVLRLQDWNFFIRVKRSCDMSMAHVAGEFQPVLTKKEASIFLLSPIDYPTDAVYPQDMEKTLVHEMIHAHFAPFWDCCEEQHRVSMEQAIESLATALISLKRKH